MESQLVLTVYMNIVLHHGRLQGAQKHDTYGIQVAWTEWATILQNLIKTSLHSSELVSLV
jgi:hypothetical protein